MRTLADYLAPGLDIAFVGLNPGCYSVHVGHYFAAPRNRFWAAVNRSGLFSGHRLHASTDHNSLEQGFGFTDVVKRASRGASDLRAADFRKWAPVLKEKLERFQPLIVCFHGATAYRNYLRYAEGVNERPDLGRQSRSIGQSTVFPRAQSQPGQRSLLARNPRVLVSTPERPARRAQETMSETIRAFVAIELPNDVKNALGAVVESVRRSDVRSLRLVRPEGVHLTLKFLGGVRPGQVSPIIEATSGVAQAHRSCTLELGSVGVFPNRRSPKVLWVGVEGQLAALIDLHRDLEDALASLGFSREARDFSPHLTLARFRDGASVADRLRASEALFSAQIESGLRIHIDALSLIRSTLRPGGAVYTRLACMPLGGAA